VPRPDLDLDIPPLVTASVLLAARQFALASGISWPGIEDILAATGASPEEAHEIEDALLDQLAALAVMAKTQTPPPDLVGLDHSADLTELELAVEMVRFIKQNPGCAQSGTHERYTDCFRRFVLELRRRYFDVTTAEFAATIDLPLDTVEDWLRGGRRGVDVSTRAKDQRATRGARARIA
jgi:hypothetical protein